MKAILSILLVLGVVVSTVHLKGVDDVLKQLRDAEEVDVVGLDEVVAVNPEEVEEETEETHVEPDNELPEDNISHDCKNVHTINEARGDGPDRAKLHKYLARVYTSRTRGIPKQYVKWNHAYGIPILGVEAFSTEAMQKACYLVRFLLADHEWFRRYSYENKMLVRGEEIKAGVCCPAKISDPQMTCPCNNVYPSLGQGSPAHELAHFFVKNVLTKMPANHFKIPEFVDNEWPSYNTTKYETPNHDTTMQTGALVNFMLKSYWQDKNRGTTKIITKNGIPKLHHYFIYTGMESFINRRAGSGELREQQRELLKKTNPNLFNLLSEVWPCNNAYITPCKDAAHGFKLGMSQKFLIGKHDPNDPSQMICENIDTEESDPAEAILKPVSTVDNVVEGTEGLKKCRKEMRNLESKEMTAVQQLRLGSRDPNEHGSEFAWWLRKCCAKTANMNPQKDAANDDDNMEKWIDDLVEDMW